MWKTDMATSVGTESNMVATLGTGVVEIPGNTRLTATTITDPVIDNTNFAYFVQCTTEGNTNTTGLYGANITYTVTGGQGAAALRPASKSKGGSTMSSTAK
jgi:hypothetical protein